MLVKMQNFDFILYLLIFALFFPTFHSIFDSKGAILLNGLLIFFLVSFIVIQGKIKYELSRCAQIVVFILFSYAVLILLSTVMGSFFSGVNIIFRDFFEIHRPVLYACVFLVSYDALQDISQLNKLDKFLWGVLICLIVFAIFGFFKLDTTVLGLYTKSANLESKRIAAPFVNPYDFAFISTFYAFYFLMKGLYVKRRYLLFFIIPFLLILASQSRSVFAGFAVGLIIVAPLFSFFVNLRLLRNFKLHKSLPWLTFCSLLSIILIYLLYMLIRDNFSYLVLAYERFLAGEEIRSGSIRKEQFMLAVKYAVNNPMILLFGNGPAKDVMEFVESVYTYYFFRYGVVGFITVFLLPLFLVIRACYKIICKVSVSSEYFPFFSALFIWFITIPFSSIGNNFTEQIRLSFFYYMMVGLSLKSEVLISKGDMS